MPTPSELTGALPDTAIAVVGSACHLPGAMDVRQYWNNLRNGVESISFFEEEELLAAGISAALLNAPGYVLASPVLERVGGFDPAFWGISPKDAAIMDPQHRHFLECAYEALEDAGHDTDRFDGTVGVFGGCGANSYLMFNLLTNPQLVDQVGMFLLRHTNNDKDFLTTFTSYQLGLDGPSVGVQTACSTSLVAIHVAAQSLLNGECDMALAGGSTVELPHLSGYRFQEGEILSPDGHCRPFDAASAGTVFGSGAGVVVLRRLADALEDGDHVHAVIRGSAINNDGDRKAGYLAPSVDGQAHAVAEALAVAELEAEAISYVECHGTGTPVGDPIEVAALTQAFRETTEGVGFCSLGSVKSNIGHTDTAAGVASFLKVVEALRHAELPPSLHFEKPNPLLELDTSPFRVQDKLAPWPQGDAPRRAGVSSTGVGGTNAHVVLEEAPTMESEAPERQLQLLPLAAKSDSALAAMAERLAIRLEEDPTLPLADVAFTLQEGRKAYPHRRVVVARDREEAIAALREVRHANSNLPAVASDTARKVAFLFPGGGAQYPGMARDLYREEAVFRDSLDRGLQLLQEQHGLDLRGLMLEDLDEEAEAALERPSLQLPAIFLVEMALAALWESWGVQPEVLLGHSLGENTAACMAGVFRYEDALGLVVLRGRLFESLPEGGMLSVALAEEELAPLLGEELVLGVRNGPALNVASGPPEALATLQQQLEGREVEWQRVPIRCAAHSPGLAPILEEFGAYLRGIPLQAPRVPMLSNRTGGWLTDAEATDPQYWVDHLRHTVRFSDNLEALLADPQRVLLEVGPGKALASLARQHPAATAEHRFLSSLRHREEKAEDTVFAAKVLGQLWMHGVALDWAPVRGEGRRIKVSLPTYPFERQDYWIEPGAGAAVADQASAGKPMRLTDFEDWFTAEQWKPVRTTPQEISTQRWLIFQDRHGTCASLAATLREQGHEVITVREGDTFYPFAETEFALSPEAGRQDYDALVQHLQAADRLPDRILHGWSLTGPKDARPGSSMFHHNEERGFYSLFFLAQAFGELEQAPPLQVDVLANHLCKVQADDVLMPEKALLFGPAAVMPREYAHAEVRVWDLDRLDVPAPPLLQDLQAETPSPRLAIRDGNLYAPHRFSAGAMDASAASLLPQEGVVLITGGLGGLGLCLAEQLAEQAQARLVLISRSVFPEPAAWPKWLEEHPPHDPTATRIRRIQALESAGAEVMVAQADVAHLEEMRALVSDVKRRFGRIDGVVHAAGILEDGIIQMRTPEAAERVFTPKVHGTLVLLDLLEKEGLNFLILCSSTSVALGPAGQVDYVAANAFLNSIAEAKDDPRGMRVLALNWGIWRDVGMAEALARRLTAQEESVRTIAFTGHPVLTEHHDGGRELQAWQGRLTASSSWLLDEHRLRDGRAVLPGTAYLDLVTAVFRDRKGAEPCTLKEVQFLEACEVGEEEEVDLRVVLRPDGEGYGFEVQSRPAESTVPWRVHAIGQVQQGVTETTTTLDAEALAVAHEEKLQDFAPGAGSLEDPQAHHLAFGPRFRTLQRLGFHGTDAFATLRLDPALAEDDLPHHPLHPGLLDAASGCAVAALPGFTPDAGLYVPIRYGSLVCHAPLPAELHVHVRQVDAGNPDTEMVRYDADLMDSAGSLCVSVRDLQLKRLAPSAFAKPSPGAAITHPHTTTPGEAAFLEALSHGIDAEHGKRALAVALQPQADPVLTVSSMDLGLLAAAQDEAMQHLEDTPEVQFERPSLSTAYAAPEDAIEQQLADWWQELLGVAEVGIDDDFFEVGGHSLVAVRLFARIKKKWQLEYPLSVLFEAPTIRGCAALIRAELPELIDGETGDGTGAGETAPPRPKHKYLVPLNDVRGRDRTPFFLVAGMFGNVLNLRHLATHLDEDQPMYAIQARGLHGDDRPHRRFEDMARDYLEEIRRLQPEGPYLLGGFSGGGITAFEMAHQLRAVGEEVGAVVLLDTPVTHVPTANRIERLLIWWERLRRGGAGYLVEWPRKRIAWEFEKRRQKASAEERDLAPAEFRSEMIQDGFIEALEHYELRPLDRPITLFRPPLDRTFELPGGRLADEYREIQDDLNHWTPFAPAGIARHEVPGDHDSMVLEPHVRVLGALVAQVLREAQDGKASGRA